MLECVWNNRIKEWEINFFDGEINKHYETVQKDKLGVRVEGLLRYFGGQKSHIEVSYR